MEHFLFNFFLALIVTSIGFAICFVVEYNNNYKYKQTAEILSDVCHNMSLDDENLDNSNYALA